MDVAQSTPRPGNALLIEFEGGCLRRPDDDELESLARAAAEPGAVLPPGSEHFVTWLLGRSPEQIRQERLERFRANRDLTRRPGWNLELAVLIDDRPVGMQTLTGFDSWPARRAIGTASWLLMPLQGRGVGTRARAAALEFAFTRLDAEVAKSWVLADNRASVAVSTRLGYEIVDRHEITEDGNRYSEHVYQLDRDRWLASEVRARYLPRIEGADDVVDALNR